MTSDEMDNRMPARSGYKEQHDGPTRKRVTMSVFRGTDKLGAIVVRADQDTQELTLSISEKNR